MKPANAFGHASSARKGQEPRRSDPGIEKSPGDGREGGIDGGEKFIAVQILRARTEHCFQDDVERHPRHCGRDIEDRVARDQSPLRNQRLCALNECRDQRPQLVVTEGRRRGATLPAPIGPFGEEEALTIDDV